MSDISGTTCTRYWTLIPFLILKPLLHSMNYKQRIIVAVGILSSLISFPQVKKVSPPKPVPPLPSAAQLTWHEMEMNAFVHFTTNTFTGLEWGNGDESEAIFNPTRLDAAQWAKTLKETGFKTLIL